jgi:hypothetical protein
MFLFGLRRRGRFFIAARIALLVALLVALFVFHAHGTTLRVLEAARLVLLIALLGSGWMLRRRRV